MGNLIAGLIRNAWYVTETLFSYGYALVESFAFIALSSIFIAWRQLTSGSAEESEEDGLVPGNHRLMQGPRKVVKIFYGSQTGTAKVSLSVNCQTVPFF